jgi:hypothetical protein
VTCLPHFVSQTRKRGPELAGRHNALVTGIAIPGLVLRLALALSFAAICIPRASSAVHPVPLDPKTDGAKCIECHNSDDNRESGLSGPNGPHGSKWLHILERQYPFSQALVPGGLIQNLNLTTDLSATGTYALCAKCHNLNNLSLSWTGHTSHVVTDGFSCSVCHTAHGMGSTSATISGQRLVNFDVNVVAQNGATPITYSYNGGSDSCTLTCHGTAHNAAMATVKRGGKRPR